MVKGSYFLESISTQDRGQAKGLFKTFLTIEERGSKTIETVFSFAICRQYGNKWLSKTLFLMIFDRSTLVDSIHNATYLVWSGMGICFITKNRRRDAKLPVQNKKNKNILKDKNKTSHGNGLKKLISVSYCMVCAYVQEDNPQALASGLSPVHAHNHTITYC